jgi:endonuclease I
MRHIISVLFFLFFCLFVFAEIPAGYYNTAEGKKDAALKTSLHLIVRDHVQLEYYSSSTYFRSTDWHPEGYFWDMYSSIKRTSWSGMNREHNMPKSWWSANPETTVAYSDLHNLYPSDAEANTAKSNYPLGEVGLNYIYDNGIIQVGTNTFSGYSGTVFEPADEYKGDFARDYMYVVTCYEDYAPMWRSMGTESMLYQNTYPVFKPYAVNLLMKWHRNDPVSQKEIDRNNAVYVIQKNRNPFVDFPALAEYLWGNKKGQAWNSTDNGNTIIETFFISYKADNKSLTVKLTPASVVPYTVFSMSGQAMISGHLSESDKTIVSLNELSRGAYLFYTQTSRETHAQIFLVL